jgi:hypothetical protein
MIHVAIFEKHLEQIFIVTLDGDRQDPRLFIPVNVGNNFKQRHFHSASPFPHKENGSRLTAFRM